jgi:hypothetical protein
LQPLPIITGRHYFAIFVLASATLSYQILVTRFFSVMLYYHFAFAAISLAMLGLTRGAMEVYNKPDRYAAERVGVEFARHASWFAITGVGARSARKTAHHDISPFINAWHPRSRVRRGWHFGHVGEIPDRTRHSGGR